MFERKLDVETFTELWNAGVSGRDIADFFNVSLRTVRIPREGLLLFKPNSFGSPYAKRP